MYYGVPYSHQKQLSMSSIYPSSSMMYPSSSMIWHGKIFKIYFTHKVKKQKQNSMHNVVPLMFFKSSYVQWICEYTQKISIRIHTKLSPVITYGARREGRKERKSRGGAGCWGQSRSGERGFKCCDIESRVVTTWVQVQILLLHSLVILGKQLNLLFPQFCHPKNGKIIAFAS